MRLWKALTAPKATKPPAEPPKVSVEPPASTEMREELAALKREREQRAAQLERIEAESRALTNLRVAMQWSIRDSAEKIWRKAQDEHPEDFDAAHLAARKSLRRSVNGLAQSRVWPEEITREFERIVSETFTPAPTPEKSGGTDPLAPSIPQHDPTPPQAPRRKSGPSGPSF